MNELSDWAAKKLTTENTENKLGQLDNKVML